MNCTLVLAIGTHTGGVKNWIFIKQKTWSLTSLRGLLCPFKSLRITQAVFLEQNQFVHDQSK